MGKHHNLFFKDNEGNSIQKICGIFSDCWTCQYILQEYNFSTWRNSTQLNEWDFLHYFKFEFELNGLGNDNILDCLTQTLTHTFLSSSKINTDFVVNNSFGLYGYFHPCVDDFTRSSLTFELVSVNPFPEDLCREITKKIKDNYFLCEINFNYGSLIFVDDLYLKNRQRKMVERSVSILKTENLPQHQLDCYYTIVSAGMTLLKFSENGLVNIILDGEVQVNSE